MIEEFTNNANQQLRDWVIEAFNLPRTTVIAISRGESREEQSSPIDTIITIDFGKNHLHEYSIPKPLTDITYEDIKLLETRVKNHCNNKHKVSSHLFRLFIYWLSFSGIYAIAIVCPCCGQPACPVGLGSATLVGGIFALFRQNWKLFGKLIYSNLLRRN